MPEKHRSKESAEQQIHEMEYRDKPLRMAKISPPKIKRIYPRKRLLHWLQKKDDLAVIWISAPAGSGKTTLIADYLANRDLHYLWFQLDAGDTDPATFFHYLGQAAQNFVPRQHLRIPRLLPNHLSGLSSFIHHYFETLYLHLKPPAVLVFDNFQELPSDAPLFSLFIEALREIPPGIQVIFLSRDKPPAWFASLQARQVATLIGWKELRLTKEESLGIAHLFESSSRHKHSKRLIAMLHQRARGWAAGLILMLQAIENEDVAIDAVNGCAREIIFNYFASELFDKADPEEQTFLLKSALLRNMSRPAVTEFTDHQHADAIFRRLHKRNYFITCREGKNPVYEYHPLFREYLLARGRATWTPEQLKKIRHQAALALFHAGQPEQAVDLFLLAEEWPEAIHTIVKQAPLLLTQGRLHTLKGWLERLPPHLLQQSGWLSYWLAVCQAHLQERIAEGRFDKAFLLFEAEKELTGMFLSIAEAARLAWINQQGYQHIDLWLDRFEKLHRRRAIPSLEMEAKVISSILMAFYFRRPNHPLVSQLVHRAEELWNSRLELNLRWHLGAAVSPFLIGSGNLLRWMESVRLFEPHNEDPAVNPEVRLSIVISAAHGDLLRGHCESCIEHVKRGLELGRRNSITLFDNWLLGAGAASALLRAELAQADHYLERMHARLAPLPPGLDTVFYQLLMSWRAHFDGDPPQARELVLAALETANATGAVFPIALCHYALAHALFASGEPHRAFHHLAKSCIRWGNSLHQQLLFYANFSKGCFSLRMGRRRSATTFLRQALHQGATQGYGPPLWLHPDLLEPALCLALEQNIEPRYVQRLIQQADIVPRDPSAIPERWPMPVRIYTLGRFLLQVNGEQLPCSARTKNRPLELLKAIIAFGCEDVAQEKVMDALWSDAEGDTAMKSLHTTLYRLRRLLGIEESVILKDGYLSLDPHYVWVDVRCLERVLDSIALELDSPHLDPDIIAHLTSIAERLFQGPFLDSEASRPWSIAPAERIRNRLIRTILMLGHFWENRGEWERAADCYRCGLELDPLAEVFYRHLMQACFKLGNHAEALTTYARCRKVLSSSLGIMPGKKTVRLYQTILRFAKKASSADDNP